MGPRELVEYLLQNTTITHPVWSSFYTTFCANTKQCHHGYVYRGLYHVETAAETFFIPHPRTTARKFSCSSTPQGVILNVLIIQMFIMKQVYGLKTH